jgi:hypothetical protein
VSDPVVKHGNPPGESYPRSYGWLGILLVVAGFAAYVPAQIVGPLRNLHGNDFKHIYLGMQALTSGADPYGARSLLQVASAHGLDDAALNPYVYLPFTGLSLAFLRPFAFPAASLAWFGINHLLMILAAAMMVGAILREPGARNWRTQAFGLLLLALSINHPLTRTLTAGQLNCVLVACYAGAFLALGAGREGIAGIVLGFAAMFKLSPGIFLFYFLFRRRWRALGAMAATCGALLAASVLAVGLQPHFDFLPMLRQMGYGHSTWEEFGATFWKDPWNQGINSLLTHVMVAGNRVTLSWFELGQGAANDATVAASLLLAGAFVFVAVRRSASAETGPGTASASLTTADAALFQAAILLSLMLPSLMWDHYLVQLLPPVAWLAWHHGHGRVRVASVLVVLLYVLTAIPWRYDAETYRSGWRVVLMSMKLLPVVCLFAFTLHAAVSPKRVAFNPARRE